MGSNPTQPAMLPVKINGPRNEGDPFFTESVLPTLGSGKDELRERGGYWRHSTFELILF